jgi:hypothetical protein
LGEEAGVTINRPVDRAKLNHVFSRHAADFGITGPWNSANAALFEQALDDHVNDPGVISIVGTHRGVDPVTHYYHPVTNLNVMIDFADDLVSGWKLSALQVFYLRTSRNIQ